MFLSISPPLLEAVKKQLGSVPNMFRLIANAPAGLEGYLGLNGALGKGQLDARTRNRLALTVAEANGCSYCLCTYLGKNVARLDDAEMAANQRRLVGSEGGRRFGVRGQAGETARTRRRG